LFALIQRYATGEPTGSRLDAARLRVSPSAARASSASQAHVTRILAKLGLRDRVPAAVLAHERGFIQAEPS
jgi:hypothetical protein